MENIIQELQKEQEIHGFIRDSFVKELAQKTGKTTAEIYGVITFYSQFKLKKPGKYIVAVCRGTACHVAGSKKLLEDVLDHYNLKEPDYTSDDGLITVEPVGCVGACSLAPTVIVHSPEGKDVIARANLQKIINFIEQKEKK